MAQFEEIEIKWRASLVSRALFKRMIRRVLDGTYKYRYLHITGHDFYYTSPTGEVARHRYGKDTNELTVKSRLSKKTTTRRREINLKLSSDMSPLHVKAAMNELGFNNEMPLFKDCDIYVLKDGKYTVDVVWYTTQGSKKGSQTFIEVEVHDAPVKVSLNLLKKWSLFIESLGLTSSDIVNQSLYEIYSGKQYKMRRKNIRSLK